jgi:hypothetical protein
MKNYYIPITEVGLVEFLSSGYIGISTSKVEYNDIHTNLWPETVVLKEILPGYSNILCEIDADVRAYSLAVTVNGKKDKIFKIRHAKSVDAIKRVIFSSQELLDDFISKYHYMEDLNVGDYELSVDNSFHIIDSPEGQLIDELGPKEITLSLSKKAVIENASDKENLLGTEKSLFAFIGAFYNFIPTDTNLSLKELNFDNSDRIVFRSIAELIGCKSPSKSLELMLQLYVDLSQNKLIDARSDQVEILEQIKENLSASLSDQIEIDRASNFIDRVINIFMGMESHPDLSGDNSEKAFQFGFYTSLMMKGLEDITQLKNQFRFSILVESIAVYLFLIRSNFSQISADNFSSFGATKRNWSGVILDVYSNPNSSLYVQADPKFNSLDLSCYLSINAKNLIRFEKGVSPVEGQVITTLQRFNVEPIRDPETGMLALTKFVDNKPVVILLEIVNFTDNHNVNEVHVQYRSEISHAVLGKTKTRIELLNSMSRKGVAIGIDDNGSLVLSRLQMVDTMDKDELWHHVEQVAEAGAALESREW